MKFLYTSLLALAVLSVSAINAQSRAVTFSFSYNTTADYTDFGGKLTDGEGGIADVPGVTYEIFYSNPAGTVDGTVRFYGYGNHSGDDNSQYFDGRKGIIYPIGQEGSTPAYQLVLQTADGSEFSFKSIYLLDYYTISASEQSVQVIGYRNGVTTGSITTNAENAQYGLLLTQANGLTPSVFQNVDKVVIRPTAGSLYPNEFWYNVNDISFGDPVVPLPVSLVSFDAQRQATGAVLLNWKTAQEKANQYFAVERSADGKEFAALGQVPAKDGSNNAYVYTDEHPLEGKNYYRLRQYDRNGAQSLSGVRLVEARNAGRLSIFPNPAATGSVVSVKNNFAGPVRVLVVNVAGQTVYAKTYTAAQSEMQISTASLAPGNYRVVLKGKDGTKASQLVVQ